ncbi:carbon storage regulator : Carbon storage regulator OS=Rhodopirellula sp. SWK7 GN=RRSWK_04365 PE=3 SV=1: CsrA [Gemmataceae bacterium]|nr:carbon storage regulator : Carbon storage regulator OS=Rhodopirellula sp. SWK7 GN=RRSWK_04365 PE=3 SV=1: CsrA [Gemmataceae bacterium]VTT99568.1 carbon storage regulator : Carbon storage regulator OS=Rhodopirellula sp. SWK7 GN=RRSWK_04365 PE=3 SV=1: CsrA [Gemmataceae bacterium]
MLVLTRRCEEQIVIGEIVITVIAIGPGRVRLGIDAPADVVVMRAELPDSFSSAVSTRPRLALAPTRKGRTT